MNKKKTAILSSYICLFQCVPVPGLGFRRGSYRCVCKRGFYFPNTTADNRYYNGIDIEEEYEKHLLVRIPTLIKSLSTFHCRLTLQRKSQYAVFNVFQ